MAHTDIVACANANIVGTGGIELSGGTALISATQSHPWPPDRIMIIRVVVSEWRSCNNNLDIVIAWTRRFASISMVMLWLWLASFYKNGYADEVILGVSDCAVSLLHHTGSMT